MRNRIRNRPHGRSGRRRRGRSRRAHSGGVSSSRAPLSAEESDQAERQGIADRTGVSLAEVEANDTYRADFRRLLQRVAESAPAAYAGAYGSGELGSRGTLVFKGALPDESRELIEESGLDVGIDTGARYSLEELQRLRDSALDAIEQSAPSARVGIGIDQAANRLSLYLSPTEELHGVLESAGISLDEHLVGRAPVVPVSWVKTPTDA